MAYLHHLIIHKCHHVCFRSSLLHFNYILQCIFYNTIYIIYILLCVLPCLPLYFMRIFLSYVYFYFHLIIVLYDVHHDFAWLLRVFLFLFLFMYTILAGGSCSCSCSCSCTRPRSLTFLNTLDFTCEWVFCPLVIIYK